MLRYYDDQGSWVEGYYDAAGAWVETSLPPGAGGAGGYAGESAAVQVPCRMCRGVAVARAVVAPLRFLFGSPLRQD